MWRTCSLAFLLLGGCDGYATTYAKAVQNQMIEADDGQNVAIANLQSEVTALRTQQGRTATIENIDTQLQQNEIVALSNEIDADRNLAHGQAEQPRP